MSAGIAPELARLPLCASAELAERGRAFGWAGLEHGRPQRAFVLFCSPGHTAVELIDVDVAVGSWVDALDLYRFMSRSFQWEKSL